MPEATNTGAVPPATTENTPGSILFGMGTIRTGLALNKTTGEITSQGTVMGATNGGGKFSVKPNMVPLSFDQKSVAVEGGFVKDGEEATMEFSLTEIKAEDIEKFVIGESAKGTDCRIVTSAESILPAHYYSGLAFVGRTAAGKPVIVLFDKAICTSGLEVEAKKGEQASPTVSFSCVGDIASPDNTLPYTVVWPTFQAV